MCGSDWITVFSVPSRQLELTLDDRKLIRRICALIEEGLQDETSQSKKFKQELTAKIKELAENRTA